MSARIDDIDAFLVKAGLGDRIVKTAKRKPAAAPFTPDSQRKSAQARAEAYEIRAEWLLKLADGAVTPADVIRAACTPELTNALRKLRLDHIHRDFEHERSIAKIHDRLRRVYVGSGAAGRFCTVVHTRTSPRSECGDFHPAQMTIGWLLNPSVRGKRFRSWADQYAGVWPGFPRRRSGEAA